MFSTAKIGLLLSALLLASCARSAVLKSVEELPQVVAQGKVIETPRRLLDATLEKLKDKTVVVEFVTDWCTYCRALKKPIRQLVKRSEGKFVFLRVDVTKDYSPLERHEMKKSFPSFKIMAPDLKVPIRRYGADSFDLLEGWLFATPGQRSEIPLKFSQTKAQKASKAVLVAGSRDNANFAQEIVLLKSILADKGLAPEEITCFYAMPDELSYNADREQFQAIQSDLSECAPTNRIEVLKTIQKGLLANPETFFLYVTSHGNPPYEGKAKAKDGERDCMPYAPSLVLDNGDNECEALNHLTPDAVASIVPDESATKKIMVFQGCYTGGFISSNDKVQKNASALARLPHMTLFTASRSDRPSFGCDAGTNLTFYGQAFLKALAEEKLSLREIDWSAIDNKTRSSVSKLEANGGTDLTSEPQFFTRP